MPIAVYPDVSSYFGDQKLILYQIPFCKTSWNDIPWVVHVVIVCALYMERSF